MTRLLIFICMLFFSLTAEARVFFLSGTEDVPLMDELKESDPETQSLFSAPSGRILSTTASGKTDWRRVMNYYNQSLPNLGWKAIGTPAHKKMIGFKRGSEKLTITLLKFRNNIVFVRFDLVQS